MSNQKLSTESYKGVRDFYPQDQFIQEYLFETMRTTCERFGYESYHASILEPAELYRSKTSEEIVNDQTYTFTDRGGREVTLRPEMTPTVTRMVAGKRRELVFPLRWYTIANMFRYERPQRGRVREHWQLNADIFGAPGVEADAEIIALAHQLMLDMGASPQAFEIRVNDRRLLNEIFTKTELDDSQKSFVMRLLDRRDKIDDFSAQLVGHIGADRAAIVEKELARANSSAYLEELLSLLYTLGIENVHIDTSIVRGFDYYTGMIFEVFDTSPENTRSLFGGGRYDNLFGLFDDEQMSAVGFGMGDVTARDFLDTHGLLPSYTPATELMLCVLEPGHMAHAMKLAHDLRTEDVTVAVNFSGKRAGDQIKHALKMGISSIICIGSHERETGQYTLKHLPSAKETVLAADRIASHLLSAQG
ncbi:MAG: histidine--tRNA ligase [Patescibacteria group bacterium]